MLMGLKNGDHPAPAILEETETFPGSTYDSIDLRRVMGVVIDNDDWVLRQNVKPTAHTAKRA
jgi:hypothetical protein